MTPEVAQTDKKWCLTSDQLVDKFIVVITSLGTHRATDVLRRRAQELVIRGLMCRGRGGKFEHFKTDLACLPTAQDKAEPIAQSNIHFTRYILLTDEFRSTKSLGRLGRS